MTGHRNLERAKIYFLSGPPFGVRPALYLWEGNEIGGKTYMQHNTPNTDNAASGLRMPRVRPLAYGVTFAFGVAAIVASLHRDWFAAAGWATAAAVLADYIRTSLRSAAIHVVTVALATAAIEQARRLPPPTDGPK